MERWKNNVRRRLFLFRHLLSTPLLTLSFNLSYILTLTFSVCVSLFVSLFPLGTKGIRSFTTSPSCGLGDWAWI